MSILLHKSLVQFRSLILQATQEQRLLVDTMAICSVCEQSRGSVLDRRRVQFVVVDGRQIPLTATDQIDDRRTLQSQAVAAAAAQIRAWRIDQMGRGLVVRGRVVQVAAGGRERMIRQLLHVNGTKVGRMAIHT